MIHAALLSLVAVVLAAGPVGGLPIPIPIFPPSEPPPAPPSGPEPPPPAPTQDADGFPDVGKPLFIDRGKGPATSKWGMISCVTAGRVSKVRDGGAPDGQGDGRRDPYRKLQVLDGDDFYGERCELGLNDHQRSPTALYREGARLITDISLKLSDRFPIKASRWQVVMQMKQTQPADDGGGVGMLSLQVFGGRWRLTDRTTLLWSAPARTDRWTRFTFDVDYSSSPSAGGIRVAVDLNGDGDALDERERTGRIDVATLKTEGPGGDDDGVAEGSAIPGHLRAGIYHDPEAYACTGFRCSIGIDDAGIYELK